MLDERMIVVENRLLIGWPVLEPLPIGSDVRPVHRIQKDVLAARLPDAFEDHEPADVREGVLLAHDPGTTVLLEALVEFVEEAEQDPSGLPDRSGQGTELVHAMDSEQLEEDEHQGAALVEVEEEPLEDQVERDLLDHRAEERERLTRNRVAGALVRFFEGIRQR